MKAIILVSAICFLGGSLAAPSTHGLQEDFQDFYKLLPVHEITEVAIDYAQNDKQVQEAIEYFQGKEFAAIWNQVTANKKFQDLITYLDDAGLHVVEHLNHIAEILGLPGYPPHLYSATFRTGGLNGFLDDIMALLPKQELQALFHKKLQTSQAFKALYDKLSHADFQKIVHFVKSSPEITNALNGLKKEGVDVNKIVEFVKSIFGWH